MFKEHSKSTDRQIMNLKRQLNREVVSTPDSHHLEPTAPGPKSQEGQEEAKGQRPCLTDEGQACIFPFNYDGEAKTSCIQKWSDRKPWCPTKTDGEGNFVSSISDNSNWGYCDFSTNCTK